MRANRRHKWACLALNMYVCTCNAITETMLESSDLSLKELLTESGGCGGCLERIEEEKDAKIDSGEVRP